MMMTVINITRWYCNLHSFGVVLANNAGIIDGGGEFS